MDLEENTMLDKEQRSNHNHLTIKLLYYLATMTAGIVRGGKNRERSYCDRENRMCL